VEEELDINQLEELLAALKNSASLAPYNLTLYRRPGDAGAGPAGFHNCCSRVQDPVSNELARHFFAQDLDGHFDKGTPTVCRYGGAFFGFVVPFSRSGYDFCLMGDGVRDQSIDLWQLAALSRREGADIFSLLPHVETLRTATVPEVEEVAREVARELGRVASFCHPVEVQSERAAGSHCSDTRLAEVALFLEQVERSRTLTETVAICCEIIGELVGVPGLAIALRQGNGISYAVSGVWGLPDDLGTIAAEAIGRFLSPGKVKQTVRFDASMREALPALQTSQITCFPLESQGQRLGFIALCDTDLTASDLLVLSILAHCVASRMAQILREAEQAQANSLSGRLMSLTHTLLHVDSKEELYQTILEIAADLLNASQGSIMLIDKNGESMHIVFTKGMTLHVAQCLPLRVGKGIAGRVAQTGQALLVNDVEKDSRVAMANRPRFKSKSLLCIPLKLKEKVIGVLNLSDKKDLTPFSEVDMQLLSSFANLASLMIERTLVLEESVRFEQLSVTDSLTGLYNRRFLKSRIEEELNRSIRQGLNLTILFIDLDFFKNYNDVCGHIAGDDALKKTADIIQASLREMDMVARYGGEEFCALLPGTSKAEALIVAERIRSEIENEKFPGEHTSPLGKLTASFGVASYPEDGRTFTALVHASDVALYQAKASGRNRIVAAQSSNAKEPKPAPITQPVAPTAPAPTVPPASASAPTAAAPAARTFDFNSYLEATESMRQKG
jgi:diguanylate cyclase (GGDEF)-like protein